MTRNQPIIAIPIVAAPSTLSHVSCCSYLHGKLERHSHEDPSPPRNAMRTIKLDDSEGENIAEGADK